MKNVIKSFEELSKIKSSQKNAPIKKDNSFEKLTPGQKKLYYEALKGLKVYSPNKLKKLSDENKERITNKFKKTQRTLNLFKQKLIISYTTFLFEKANINPKVINILNVNTKPSTNYLCNMDFEQLNITKTDIVKVLINEKILPNNFSEL